MFQPADYGSALGPSTRTRGSTFMVAVGSHLLKGCLEPNEAVEGWEMGPPVDTDVVVVDQSLIL